MTTLTAAPSRRSLFLAWLKTNLIAAGISLLLLAGAGFLMLMGIVFTAMAGNPLGLVLLIVALPLGVAGVAWLGAAQAQALGFSRWIGGLLMLLAAFAGIVAQFSIVPALLYWLIPARQVSLAFHPLEAVIVPVVPGMAGLLLGLCQARLAPWLQPRTLHWTLATGLGWFLSALAFGGAYIVSYNSSGTGNVTAIQSFGLAGAAMVVVFIVTGLAYANLRAAASAPPDPAGSTPTPLA